jgi:hypothetical protein
MQHSRRFNQFLLTYWSRLSVVWLLLAASMDPIQAKPQLSADEIVQRAHETAKKKGKHESVYTFLREVIVKELDNKARVAKETTKTFRAYTDEREQELLTINGRDATAEDKEKERQRSRKQKSKFLNADPTNPAATGGREENLMDRNITLFHEKFVPKLLRNETVRDREAYMIDLVPNPKHRIKHNIVDRIFNNLAITVWIDHEDFEVAKLEARLLDNVAFLGGLAGAVKGIQISVDQARLEENHWVDQGVKALFDARVLWKSFHFGIQSQSSEYQRLD